MNNSGSVLCSQCRKRLDSVHVYRSAGGETTLVNYIAEDYIGQETAYFQEETGTELYTHLLDSINGILEEITTKLMVSNGQYSQLAYGYMKMNRDASLQFYAVPLQVREIKENALSNKIADLTITYREAFADLCMLYFLKMSAERYFDLVARSWEDLEDNYGMCTRMYLTLRALGQTDGEIRSAFQTWAEKKHVDKEIRDNADDMFCDLSMRLADPTVPESFILQYLSDCVSNLRTKYGGGEGKNPVHSAHVSDHYLLWQRNQIQEYPECH